MRLFQAQTRPKIELSGVSFINLLGKYGNFETDSNADGLADGWTNDTGLTAVANAMETTNKIFGSKAQKVTLSADGEGGNYTEVTVAAAQALFVAGYIRAGDTSTTGKLIVDWRDNTNTQISTDTVGTRAVASYARVSAALTAPENTVKARIYATVAGVSGKLAYFDGIQVHNLTAQGALDSIRAAKYSETNWSDLTEEQLEAEIPYFDSVMSVNVEDGTASELTVENRGKNLINSTDSFVNSNYLGITTSKTYFSITGNRVNILVSSGTAWRGFSVGKIPIDPSKTYKLSCIGLNEGTGGLMTYIFCYDSSGYIIKENRINGWTMHATSGANYSYISYYGTLSTKTITFTDADVAKIAICFGVVSNNTPPYPFVWDIQLEEGTSATAYVPPRTDSITIPDSVELHGYNGVFNTIDDAGKFTKRLDRVTETSDGSGDIDFSGYDYESGSTAILRNKTTGEVKTLTVSDTIACGWNSVDVEIIYQLETPTTSQLDIDFHDLAYDTLNTLVFTDAKAPIAFSLNGKPLSGYISGTFPFGKKQILQR